MKSIVQEGSTISKAVESAWQSAGKPQEFTVKVLEEPIHNFIGMTTRSAKVALFFKEPVSSNKPAHDKSERFARNERTERKDDRDKRSRPKKPARAPRPETTARAPYAKDSRPAQEETASWVTKEREPRQQRPQNRPAYTEQVKDQTQHQDAAEEAGFDGVFWTPEMITMAKDWLQGSLAAMNLPHINYSTEVNRLYFKVSFDEPVDANVAAERQIFRSFAMLLMQHMRNRLKRPLKGFKVVLSRGGLDVEDE